MEPAAEDARSNQMMAPATEDGRCDGGQWEKGRGDGEEGLKPFDGDGAHRGIDRSSPRSSRRLRPAAGSPVDEEEERKVRDNDGLTDGSGIEKERTCISK
jgi:hypothetical protein